MTLNHGIFSKEEDISRHYEMEAYQRYRDS